jgi:saccharopine dehydrogenase-like NADP-dependent oxidoreductase
MSGFFHIFGSGGIGQSAITVLETCFPGSVYHVYDINFSGMDFYFQNLDENLKRRITQKEYIISKNPQLKVTGDFVLDCTPGHLAPYVATIAINSGLGYINLTEYVDETEIIMKLAEFYQDSAIVLQSGVAPGFVNIAGKKLVEKAKNQFKSVKLDSLQMMVGALSENARAPHYYAFTWSPVGVATEYLKPSDIVKDHKFTKVNSLEFITGHIINGDSLESSHTSGGVADLAVKFASEIKNISYQTLRFPGHFQWVKNLIKDNQISDPQVLLTEMERLIPFVEDDKIIIYTYVDYYNHLNKLHSISASYEVKPHTLFGIKHRAIQLATAIPMVVTIDWVLQNHKSGIITQSMIDTDFILNHELIRKYFHAKIEENETTLV